MCTFFHCNYIYVTIPNRDAEVIGEPPLDGQVMFKDMKTPMLTYSLLNHILESHIRLLIIAFMMDLKSIKSSAS